MGLLGLMGLLGEKQPGSSHTCTFGGVGRPAPSARGRETGAERGVLGGLGDPR
jgi:hypothetical protein